MAVAKLIHGAETLDLLATPYSAMDFVPPAEAPVHNIARGTSANRLNGGSYISSTWNNRVLSFGVRVLGTSQYAVEGSVRRLQMFIDQCNDGTPLYLLFSSTAVPVPLWGQLGQPLYYEIVTGTANLTDTYNDSRLREAGQRVNVTLEIKPVALGTKQRVASAVGAVVEDALGKSDGLARGLRILPAGDNNSENPRFGHATWNTGWTAGANIIEVKNTDTNYIYPGATCSARLTSMGATNNSYTETVNVGNTNNHIYWVVAKRHDGAAVTSDDLQYIYNGTAQSTTFTNLGNGFYACSYSRAGENTDRAVGIVVKAGRTVYLCYHMIEESALRTYPGCGADLGWAWTGTAHAGASTRTAGRVRLAVETGTLNIGHGAIAFTWKSDYANTAAGDRFFFSCGAASLRAYYLAADDKIYLTDNTNTISTAAQTFSAGATYRLLFVWGPSGLAIYSSGSSVASGATYTPPANPTYVYIGTDDSAANHCGGVIGGFSIFPNEPTSTERAAIDAAMSALVTAERRTDYIPWLWTFTSGGYIDAALDSTHRNYAISAGIPGDLEAKTQWYITPYTDRPTTYLMCRADDVFIDPNNQWFFDISGTADASASGGESYQATVGGGTALTKQDMIFTVARPELYNGTVSAFVRARHDYGNGLYQLEASCIHLSGTAPLTNDVTTVDLNVNYGLFRLRGFPAYAPISDKVNSMGIRAALAFYADGTGTSGTLCIDYLILWIGNCAKITQSLFPHPATASIYLDGDTATGHSIDAGAVYEVAEVEGDTINLEPDKVNTVILHSGGELDSTLALNARFDAVYVQPRWKLL